MLDLTLIFIEQLSLIWLKLFRQQQRNGREFLKSAIMTPLFIIIFTTYVLFRYDIYFDYYIFSNIRRMFQLFQAPSQSTKRRVLMISILYHLCQRHPDGEYLMQLLTDNLPMAYILSVYTTLQIIIRGFSN